MKRALVLFALLCGCGSSVTLGTLPTDGGVLGPDMDCGDCVVGDMWLPPPSVLDLGFDPPGDFGPRGDLR